MSKILFVCKQRMSYGAYGYGATYGLQNSAKFVSNCLRQSGLDSQVVVVPDANHIDRVVTSYNPTHVFIEALWVTPEKLKELLSLQRHMNRQWCIRLHSRLAFLANEGIAFPWLLEYRDKIMIDHPNLWVGPNTRELTNELNGSFDLPSIYLPNIYQPPIYKHYSCRRHERVLDVGCFGAIRPFKNHLVQAVAAVRYGDLRDIRVRVHINATRTEQLGENVLKNLRAFFEGQSRHKLVEHDWMSHSNFIHCLRHMDVSLQASFTETFNIVAADSVHNGIPLVGTRCMEWLPGVLQVHDPNSTEEIVWKMGVALGWMSRPLRWLARKSLLHWNSVGKRIWLDFLEE